MRFSDDLSRTEKRLIKAALVLILLLLALLKLGSFRRASSIMNEGAIGEVTATVADVRYKAKREFSWEEAATRQNLGLGDSLFTGKRSTTHVSLKNGGELSIGENSLVKFREISSLKLADLDNGNYSLSVNGEVSIGIQGEATTFRGDGRVHIYVDDKHRAHLTLLDGHVTANSDILKGNYNQAGPPRIVAGTLKAIPPHPLPQTNPIIVPLRLADMFDVGPRGLIPRLQLPTTTLVDDILRWDPGTGGPFTIQISRTSDFAHPHELHSDESRAVGREMNVGMNFWRVRGKAGAWSESQKIDVKIAPIHDAPTLAWREHTETLITDSTVVSLNWKFPMTALGYVVEMSSTATFESPTTDYFWLKNSEVSFRLRRPQVSYVRVAGVTTSYQLSRWSDIAQIQLLTPKLAHRTQRKPPRAIAAVPSSPPVQKHEAEAPPATESLATTLAWVAPSTAQNSAYRNSRFSIEGATFAYFSTEQKFQQSTLPIGTTLAIRDLTWMNNTGFEGLIKGKASNVNSASDDVSPFFAEARIHHRILLEPKWSLMTEVQLSAFAGIEHYSNRPSPTYVSGYDIFKLGSLIEFPVARRWDMGGEISYGLALDASTKYEISGHLNYYLVRNWSVGAGYRASFFEAASAKSTPTILPYREGYGEGYSTLRYHY